MSAALRMVLLRGVLSSFALSVLGAGCHSDVEERLVLAGLSSPCRINSDCVSALVCAFQTCHQECAASRDCEHGSRCVAGVSGRNVCQLPEEQGCSASGACPGAEICGVDAECRDGCVTARDCVAEQLCTGGVCADPGELDASGHLTPSEQRPASVPIPCAYDSDCPGTERCGSGGCRPECSANSDCPAGQPCLDGGCVEPTSSGCLYNSDCSANEICTAGSCKKGVAPPLPECESSADCVRAGQHCVAGRCRCECATADECARNQACTDACQCVPAGVLYGDVDISDLVQLAELENVVEITGQLQIRVSGTVSELHVPHLRTLGSLYVSPSHGGPLAVTFDELEVVGMTNCGAPSVCTFPKLMQGDNP